MKTGYWLEMCRAVFVALWRPLVLVGALCVVAAPAHAQSNFQITDGSGTVVQATLTNRGQTLTFNGPAGRFVFTYEQEYNTQTHIGYSSTGEIQMLRWPRGGTGALIAYVEGDDDRGGQWTNVGTVRPVVPTQPQPRPQPKPQPPPDRFPTKSWRAHNAAIFDLDIRLDGRFLASGDARGATRNWDLTTYRAVGNWNRPGPGVAFRRGGNLALGGNGAVSVLRANTTVQAPDVPQRVNAVAYRWDGELLAAGDMHQSARSRSLFGAIRLWHDDGSSIHPIRLLRRNDGSAVRSMAFGPNNQFLFTAGGGEEDESLGSVTRWDLGNYQPVQHARFRGVAYSISTAIQDASRGVLVAFGGVRIEGGRKAGFVTVMRPDGTKTEAQNAPVYAVDLCRDGTQLAAGSGKFVLLWAGDSDTPIRLPTSGVVRSVAFSPDGSRLAAGGTDGVITVWTVRSSRQAPSIVPVYRVQIKVLDGRTKKPIPDARITPQGGAGGCTRLAWYRPSAIHRFEATKAGRYSFVVRHKDYPAQTVQYQVGAKEYVQTVQLNRTVVPPKPDPRPQPKKFTLLLRVQHGDGTPVESPLIKLTAGPGRVTPRGEQPRGIHRFEVTKAGEYRFAISKQDYTPQTFSARADGREKTVVLHRVFKLLLTILDGDNQPVLKPEIKISGPGRETGPRDEGPRGTHTLSLTTNGAYKVTVRKKGLKEQDITAQIRGPETRKTITMPWGFELRLAVVDTDQRAIDRPTIEIKGPGKAEKVSSSGAAHTYAFTSNGLHRITVSKAGYETRSKTLDITLGTGKNTFELVPIEYELVVRVPDDGGLDVKAPAGRQATRKADGAYALRLRPGTYKVELKTDDETVDGRRVTIQSSDVELRLGPDSLALARKYHRQLDENGNSDGIVDESDFARGWDEIRKAFDLDRNGKLEVEEIAQQLTMTGQDEDEAPARPPVTSGADTLQRKLDAMPRTKSGKAGWAKKDFDEETWKFFEKLDVNKDDEIDPAEQKRFVDAMEKQALADTVNDPEATTMPTALFSLRRRLRKLDRAGDGVGRNDVPADTWLWVFRNFDTNPENDRLDPTEELAFLVEFQSVATGFLSGTGTLVEVLRPLFRKRDKNGNGVDDREVDATTWNSVLTKYDTDPKNGRIDRNTEETNFLRDYHHKLSGLFQLLVEADRVRAAPPAKDRAAQLRANLKRMDKKNDGLDKGDVDASTWTDLLAQYDKNGNDWLEPAEEDELIQIWLKQIDESDGRSDEGDATKRSVLTIRKVASG
jgi:WD40 repeat protein